MIQNIIIIGYSIYIIKTIYKNISDDSWKKLNIILMNYQTILGLIIIIETITKTISIPFISYQFPLIHIFITSINIMSVYLISNDFYIITYTL